MIETAVILAGGKGERMRPITEYQPKALVPIFDKCILERQIDQLIDIGVKEVIVLAGFLGEQIKHFLEIKKYEIKVVCKISNPDFSSEERLIQYLEHIDKDYVIVYCDNFIPDNEAIFRQFRASEQFKLLIEKRDKGNFSVISSGLEYSGAIRESSSPFVELGYIAVRNSIFNSILKETKNFGKVFETLSNNGLLSYQELFGGYFSVSNLQRYIDQNLCDKVIILDRDGVINHKMPKREYISSIDNFNYIEENLAIFSNLSEGGYKFVIASNQPGVALGSVAEEFLSALHQKITSDLRLIGVHILGFYICKHHWDDKCACRKPKPGLLNSICKDFRLSPQNTTFIGDEDTDLEAANLAGMKGIKFSNSDPALNKLLTLNL